MLNDIVTVYMITHKITKRMYIGSSRNVAKRISSHLKLLQSGKHNIEDMQRDYDTYGEYYDVTIFGEKHGLRDLEYEMMYKYNSRTRSVGYNYKDNHGTPKRTGYYMVKLLMSRLGITYENIAEVIGYSYGTTMAKLSGRYPLTLNEAKIIRDIVAPEMSLDILFEEAS